MDRTICSQGWTEAGALAASDELAAMCKLERDAGVDRETPGIGGTVLGVRRRLYRRGDEATTREAEGLLVEKVVRNQGSAENLRVRIYDTAWTKFACIFTISSGNVSHIERRAVSWEVPGR